MIFTDIAPAAAEGAILVHSIALPDGKMKKGRVLSAHDVDRLAAADIEKIKVVRLEPTDIGEDEAASAIAAAATGAGTERQAAFTGRCNIHAIAAGVLVIDSARINALNAIDEAVTVATLPAYQVVEPGQMLATVKIIPFAAPADAVVHAVAIAGEAQLITVASFKPHDAGLIMTRLDDTRDKVLNKTAEVLSERLNRYGSRIAQQARCAHEAGAIAAAVAEQHAAGCNPILIFGASAITDRRDEIPAGIEQAGGTVERFGMPVDPGNLLLLARHGDVPVIGLPGCARSPKLNGFDWVLERLLADIAVTDGDIADMGVGGLLKEIPSRPQPRLGDQPATSGRVARIAALILAAGQSRRMGAENKLLADVGGRPMVSIAADAAAASQAVRTIVVTGHEKDSVRAVLKGDGVEFVNNPDYAEGLSTSLKAGVAAMPDDIDGVVVLLGDMPKVTPAHINALIAAFDPLEGRSICVPTHRGKRGNPVLFSRNIFAEIADVAGDVGAKYLIGQHEDEVAEVPVGDDGIFADVDTPQALASIRRAG